MATETCPLEIPSELVRSDTEDSEVVSLGVDILLPQITRLETEKSKSKIVNFSYYYSIIYLFIFWIMNISGHRSYSRR